MAPPGELSVEVVEQDVGKQRRERAAHHPGFEVTPHEHQDALVAHTFCETAYKRVVVHAVEEAGDVEIDHDAVAVLDVPPRSLHRLVRAAPRPETAAVR